MQRAPPPRPGISAELSSHRPMAYRAAGLQVTEGAGHRRAWQTINAGYDQVSKARFERATRARSGLRLPLPLPSPVSVHVIKASYIGVLASIILRKVLRVQIITHTISQLVCSIAAAIS